MTCQIFTDENLSYFDWLSYSMSMLAMLYTRVILATNTLVPCTVYSSTCWRLCLHITVAVGLVTSWVRKVHLINVLTRPLELANRSPSRSISWLLRSMLDAGALPSNRHVEATMLAVVLEHYVTLVSK